MKRARFERPTDHYDEGIFSIDEQICALIKQRKELSNNNPGFPEPEYITKWAEKYGLYEDLLNSVFVDLLNEDYLRPMIEPKHFQKFIPILKSVEEDMVFYSVTFIRQYENASVVNFNIDLTVENEEASEEHMRHRFFELYIGEQYDCRMGMGSGSGGHLSYKYIVTPPLPEEVSGLELVFKEHRATFLNVTTGHEIVIQL
ncbi:hypothetical protein [Fredinandcohnia quinoae]|uniref:Uncharacterized protein n=1 Tax=Fredinandcohnia quinoae TaxID=2918902 RepID=A0AAW5E1U2_9BACI|nr:hypothetical protein [Fredinandcohnia sp. SECRCQ15]MCH1626866.1 hypothetical protein [Fredinandcohnia sp. SECRCQ15]